MKDALLIVAAGKSSRFGGYPKALCMLKDGMNVENTIRFAKKAFSSVYLGLNTETAEKYRDLKLDAKVLSITTGQGDALSLLKMVRLVLEDDQEIGRLYVCWGDAFFVDELPFLQFKNQLGEDDCHVACSIDEKPYAWFDTDDDGYIISSHFKKNDGEIPEGIHDQSLFAFKPLKLMKYIEAYKDYAGVKNEDYDPEETKEVKLLDLFTYLYGIGLPVKTILIDKNKVLSFNTREELDRIIEEYC